MGSAVRFRTISIVSATPGSEPAYGEFAAFLDNLRREFPRAAAALRWEQVGDLALLLSWASGDSNAPGLLFYAHFDVVPAGEESAWSRPPFSGKVEDGYIWGRGTLDNKNCLIGIMEAVESLLSEGFQPSMAIYLAFGGDEELGGAFGAGIIARTLADRGVRLKCVFDEGSAITDGILSFIPRPIAMIGIAEKGFANIEIVVEGKPGHSAMPGRGTVPGALAAVVAGIEKKPFPARLTPTAARFFRALAPHARGAIRLALRFLRPLWPLLKGALTADPSVDSLLRTTQAVTIIKTGQVPNVIPSQARAVINVRLLPGDTAQSALARMGWSGSRARTSPGAFPFSCIFLPARWSATLFLNSRWTPSCGKS
ncbi:MAG: M20/M25/M40 family metallo-hydrolase [Spirochaetia bacterium]